MKCLWCKQHTDDSKSVEHILPESLGNQAYTLPRGWVCDRCNNYLARKIEKPFLESYYGRVARFASGVPSKKGRIPPLTGIHLQSMLPVEVMKDKGDGSLSIGMAKESDEPIWIRSVTQSQRGTLILPTVTEPPNDRTLARFIAKVGLEVLAGRCIGIDGWNEELVNQTALDEIRRYVRYGTPSNIWPVHMRRLYPSEMRFVDGGESFEVLHEWTVLVTTSQEHYAVIAFFGVEYTINLGGPELDGYVAWLQKSNNRSPLYWNVESGSEPKTEVAYFK